MELDLNLVISGDRDFLLAVGIYRVCARTLWWCKVAVTASSIFKMEEKSCQSEF